MSAITTVVPSICEIVLTGVVSSLMYNFKVPSFTVSLNVTVILVLSPFATVAASTS